MNEEFYYVIHTSCDGSTLHRMTKAELLKSLKEGYWGPTGQLDELRFNTGGYVDLTEQSGILIIKGTEVWPQEKVVVREYDIP